jgi:transposase-like protein
MGRRRRRRHSAQFKADTVAACLQPGVSIAAIALSRGLNANLLRRWVVEAERTGAHLTKPASAALQAHGSFVPVPLPPLMTEPVIRMELRSASGTVVVQWPVSAGAQCAAVLRELMR